MSDDRSVEEMANEVLMRQAKVRADRSGETIEEALEAVLKTEAGTQLRELRDVPHDEESVEEWQVGMARERAPSRAIACRFNDKNVNIEPYAPNVVEAPFSAPLCQAALHEGA